MQANGFRLKHEGIIGRTGIAAGGKGNEVMGNESRVSKGGRGGEALNPRNCRTGDGDRITKLTTGSSTRLPGLLYDTEVKRRQVGNGRVCIRKVKVDNARLVISCSRARGGCGFKL